jgi:hypothetical protein
MSEVLNPVICRVDQLLLPDARTQPLRVDHRNVAGVGTTDLSRRGPEFGPGFTDDVVKRGSRVEDVMHKLRARKSQHASVVVMKGLVANDCNELASKDTLRQIQRPGAEVFGHFGAFARARIEGGV